jgi:stress-induced morphogen
MNDFLNFVENKVKENIKVESITVIDNSALHKKHKFFDKTKYHLRQGKIAIEITMYIGLT